ncbi:DNA-binding response regulator [Brachybacterium ginsengisoli]|uniref:DNA-binding response regulator n=1 Tax=Brachybacterium ginsengisoli TaxID=1331682 RepID=A0A291GXR3_9MICO|nr:response regulator transcription factor [Brachybacterium ginsengisoli]ATG55000.1 DNA-binding response regulator [Brachybacterium ginsengisoli]
MIRVLVADDQDLVRAGIVATVDAQEGMTVVGEAADGAEAVRAADLHHPEVILMDIRMPGSDGLDATRRILAAHPDARVLVLTTFDADELVHAALAAGACGFLVKDAPIAELTASIRAAARGDAVLSPAITAHVVERLLAHPPAGTTHILPPAADRLTRRELEIVRLIADGLSNLEIAGIVHLSEATVKTHVGRVLTKLALRDRVQVAVWAHRHGIARPPAQDG